MPIYHTPPSAWVHGTCAFLLAQVKVANGGSSSCENPIQLKKERKKIGCVAPNVESIKKMKTLGLVLLLVLSRLFFN